MSGAAATRPAVSPSLGLWAVAVLALSVVCFLYVDRPLALWLKGTLPAEWVEIGHLVSRLGDATGYVLIALAAVAWCRFAPEADAAAAAARERVLRWCVLLVVALAASGIFVNLVKFLVGRLRPRALFESGLYGLDPLHLPHSMNGWPSGHSQTIWVLVTVLVLALPRWRAAWLAVGVAVAASRVWVTSHYLGDVFAGSFVGIAAVLLLKPHIVDAPALPGPLARLARPRPPVTAGD